MLIAGVLVCAAVAFFDKLRIDDPVGAISGSWCLWSLRRAMRGDLRRWDGLLWGVPGMVCREV